MYFLKIICHYIH